MGRRNASQLARAAGSEIRKSLLGKLIEAARLGVALNPLIEARGLEFLEPGTNFAS